MVDFSRKLSILPIVGGSAFALDWVAADGEALESLDFFWRTGPPIWDRFPQQIGLQNPLQIRLQSDSISTFSGRWTV